jgi:UTP--glucose-1-phosphate uridylyltransferase
LLRATKIIEKPDSKEAAPSNIATVSGYVFEPELFAYLHEDLKTLKTGEEFYMQPSIQKMMDEGRDVWALEIKDGKFYDTGNKLEYLKTVVDFALENEEFGTEFKQYLHGRINSGKRGENK